MDQLLSERIQKAKSSGTVRLAQIARDYLAAGRKIIDLAEGEPDFDTPESVVEGAFQAAKSGATRYTSVGGTKQLLAAIADKFSRENNLEYDHDQIMASSGAKQVIFNAMLCTVNTNDEVIIPSPYWVSYPDIVQLCGGKTVVVSCKPSDGFKLRPQQLREVISKQTKWLILNSPNNPTGAVYTRAELSGLAEVLCEYPNVLVLCDDIYEHIVYQPNIFATLAEVEPRLKERTLTVNGVSKAYAMTGWRIGYAGGPKFLVAAMTKLQGQSTTNPSSVSQAAAVAALEGRQDLLSERREIYRKRRNQMLLSINSIDGLSTEAPDGGFYLFVCCEDLVGRRKPSGELLTSDADLVEFFLESSEVVLVPGSEFGLSHYFRLCFAQETDVLALAVKRINEVCEVLR